MSLKESLQHRIEKNAIKSTLSYEKSNGEIVTEDVLIKRSNFPLIGDWQRIYPILNEDGSWNFINLVFGGKKNLYKLLAIMAILALLFWWVTGIIGANKEYMNGQKYVIVPKVSFEKFCLQSIKENGGNLQYLNNLTIVSFDDLKG